MLFTLKQALTTSGKSQKQKHLQKDVREAFKWPWRQFTQEHLPSTWWERRSLTVNWPHHNFQLTFSKLSFNKRHCVGTCKSDYADRRRSLEHIQCDIRNRQSFCCNCNCCMNSIGLEFHCQLRVCQATQKTTTMNDASNFCNKTYDQTDLYIDFLFKHLLMLYSDLNDQCQDLN